MTLEVELRKEILDFVREHGGVSFVEIARLLGDRFKGEYAVAVPGFPNVVLWSGIDADVADVLCDLLQSGDIEMKPTDPLVYMMDGGYSGLPVAHKLWPYKKPHWLPVVFDAAVVTPEDVRRGLEKLAGEYDRPNEAQAREGNDGA